jgi:MMP 1-O-methyltransferase
MLLQKFRRKSDLKRIEGFRKLDGWLTDQEALGLYRMAVSAGRDAVIVEIGSWQGKSTYCLASGLRSGKVYAIDPFSGEAGEDQDSRKEYEEKKAGKNLAEIFRGNMNGLGVWQKIEMMQGFSQQFNKSFRQINALFIDGDHSIPGCTNDFNLYADKILHGGFLAFHDYYPDRPTLGPTYVIQNLVIPDPRFHFYKQYDSLWIARRSQS